MSSLSPSSKLLSLIGTAIVVFPARAEQFSWQLSGVTSRLEAGDFANDSWAVDATYYLNPIDDSAGPLGLASFLNPTTRVSAAATRSDADFFRNPAAYTLTGAYVLPGEHWYVGASYARSEAQDTPSMTWSDPNGYGVLAGRYLGASTTLELRLGRSEEGYDTSLTCPPGMEGCVAGPVALDETSDSLSLELFHVRRFRSLTYSLQASVSETENEEVFHSPMGSWAGRGTLRAYSVAGELFPTDRLGVRVGYSLPYGDGADAAYDVTATWFFKPRVALQLGLSRTSIDDAELEPESIAVRFIGRL